MKKEDYIDITKQCPQSKEKKTGLLVTTDCKLNFQFLCACLQLNQQTDHRFRNPQGYSVQTIPVISQENGSGEKQCIG